MNIEYNPFEDVKMPKMYSYTGEYYIDYDKLRFRKESLGYLDFLMNITDKVKWIIFSSKMDYDCVLIALGVDAEENYYLSTYGYGSCEAWDAIMECENQKDVEDVFDAIKSAIVKVSNFQYLEEVMIEKVLGDFYNFNDWMTFLTQLKDMFGDTIHLDNLGEALTDSIICNSFGGYKLNSLEDFIDYAINFKTIFPKREVRIVFRDDSLLGNWLDLMLDYLDLNSMTVKELAEYKIKNQEFLDFGCRDLKEMSKEIMKKNNAPSLTTEERLMKMKEILNRAHQNVKAIAFVDRDSPTVIVFLYREDDDTTNCADLAKELCMLFGYDWEEDKAKGYAYIETELIKHFSRYYVERDWKHQYLIKSKSKYSIHWGEEMYELKHCSIANATEGKKKFFAISDIHGHIIEFKLLLDAWNPEEQTLVLVGDYVDRGVCSKDVLDEIIKLKEQYKDKDKVIVLRGNHDDALLDNLIEYRKYPFGIDLSITDSTTLYDIVDSNDMDTYIRLIRDMKLYHQEGKLLFTHAGYNTRLDDWRDTSKHDFLWIRNHYQQPYGSENKTGLLNIFGHTPGNSIAGHRKPEIFTMYKHEGFIGIDGGVFDNGRLNGIVIDEDGALLDYYYARDFNREERNLSRSYTFYPDDDERTNHKNKR